MFDDLWHDRPALPAIFSSPSFSIQTPEGRVRCHKAGTGRMVLLLHGFSSLGTSLEMRPLFESLAEVRCAVALDWLGFGESERPERTFTAETYKTVLRTVVSGLERQSKDETVAGGLSGRGIDVVAGSLAAQYVAIAAGREPERFGRLVFISPTGLGRHPPAFGLTAKTSGVTLRLPGLGRRVFDGITSRKGIRRSLENLFADSARIPGEYERYAWASARQPGAHHAPLNHLAGLLDDPAAPEAFRALDRPTLMIFGGRARLSNSAAWFELARSNRNVTVRLVPEAGDLPQLEQPERTAAMVSKWLAGDARGR